MSGPLNPEEERVIVRGGTEKPFSGKYCGHFERGIYLCRRCGSALYLSGSKFDAGCGWPSFDRELPGAVLRRPDRDGHRTEIVCSACGAHLGHVFTGEKFTPEDTRHCVNSVSLRFLPGQLIEKAVFAAGCFWGVEQGFRNLQGVVWTRVGYTGGTLENPSYERVCSGGTGHYEAVEVSFDPEKIKYEELLEVFFSMHDFTRTDGQGPDTGEQYLSAVFYNSPAQKIAAETKLRQLRTGNRSVATKILPAGRFWQAEDYHQHYLEKRGRGGACGG